MSDQAVRTTGATATTSAWLLTLGDGLRVAVGGTELQHLAPSPRLFRIPGAPAHCRQVLLWQERVLPVMDVLGWVTGREAGHTASLVGIVAYRNRHDGAVGYGGLLLAEIPQRMTVSDDQVCALPEDGRKWSAIAISCFARADDTPVPVLDLPYLFSGALVGRQGMVSF